MGRELKDGTEIAKTIFSAIKSIQKKFGVNYICQVLIGSNSIKIQGHQHNQITEHGALNTYSFEQIKVWVKELLEKGYLEQSKNEYPVVNLTEKAAVVLRGFERVNLSEVDPNLERKTFFGEKGESVAKTMEQFRQGKSVGEIATERNLAVATILSHLAQAYTQGEQIDIDQFVDSKKQETIAEAFKKQGMDYLSPVKEVLGPAYSWEDLKLVRAKLLREQNAASALV